MSNKDSGAPFSREAITRLDKTEPGNEASQPVKLNAIASQVAHQYRRDTISPVMVSGLMRMAEFGLVLVSGLAIFAVYVGLDTHLAFVYPLVILAGALLYVLLIEMTDGYQIMALRNPAHQLGRQLLAWIGVFALLALAGFLLKISEEYSRFWFVTWFCTGLALIIVLRFIIARKIRGWARNGTMERRAVIVGGGKNAEELIRSLEQQPDNDIRICGIFDDRDNRRSPPIVAGYPKLGNVSELIEFARIAHIDMLIVSLPITAEARVLSMLKKLWVLPVDIRLSAHTNHLRFRPRAYSYIGAVPMLDIFDKPINDWDSVAKRAFDIVFSLIGIIVFSPIMLLTALAIRLESKGPVIFKQQRHGFNNEIIEVWKFRSMSTAPDRKS